jgi:hypothetical protein
LYICRTLKRRKLKWQREILKVLVLFQKSLPLAYIKLKNKNKKEIMKMMTQKQFNRTLNWGLFTRFIKSLILIASMILILKELYLIAALLLPVFACVDIIDMVAFTLFYLKRML